jgi:hypothetical protein
MRFSKGKNGLKTAFGLLFDKIIRQEGRKRLYGPLYATIGGILNCIAIDDFAVFEYCA